MEEGFWLDLGRIVVDFGDFLEAAVERPRGTGGAPTAPSNIEMAFASLLYHFDWELPGGADPSELDMDEAYGITARRKTPYFKKTISHGECNKPDNLSLWLVRLP